MSSPRHEILEYKNETFLLFGNPLRRFLEIREDIKFEYYCTGSPWGYHGTWTINEDKLYLIKLECLHYSIEDIFNTQPPILAEWFTGTLEVGIGIHKPTDYYFPLFDNHLILNIENGVIVERKIIKKFSDEFTLQFGKYKGIKFHNIIYGKFIYDNPYPQIHDYIYSLLRYFSDEQFEYSILTPFTQFNKITERGKDFLNKFKLHTFNYSILDNCVDIGLNYYSDEQADELLLDNALSQLISIILSLDFDKLVVFDPNKGTLKPIATSCFLLNPDINYLEWALSTVDTFFVPPYLLEKIYRIKKLKTFEVHRINYTKFSFKPIFEQQKFVFPQKIKEKNKLKFQSHYSNLNFDAQKDYFVVNEEYQEMINKYGFYLDDNIINKYKPHISKNYHLKGNRMERQRFGKYSGTYAQSTEWLSDNFIDDVLGGEPDAYWNID